MTRPDDDLANDLEVAAALRSLGEAELLRIEQFARFRAYGLPWLDWQDLFHEAISRTLAGERRWPRHVPFVVYLRECMRSIAHEELRQRSEGPVTTEAELLLPDAPAEQDLIASAVDPAAGPERMLAASEAVDAIFSAFSDDQEAQDVLSGLAEGLTPDEVCASSGMTRTQYESAQKRIRRRLARSQRDAEPKRTLQ